MGRTVRKAAAAIGGGPYVAWYRLTRESVWLPIVEHYATPALAWTALLGRRRKYPGADFMVLAMSRHPRDVEC